MTQSDAANAKYARDAWLRALQRTASIEREPLGTLPLLIGRLAERYQSAPALVASDASLTYRQLAERCHRYARWGLGQGLAAGDVAALMLPNCADYLPVWLGLTRLGVTVALINGHLAGDPLAHSIRIAAPKLVIVGTEYVGALAAVRGRLPRTLACWIHGADSAPERSTPSGSKRPGTKESRPQQPGRQEPGPTPAGSDDSASQDFIPLEPALASVAGEPLTAAERAPPSLDMTALYIYTSGTTGLPKAAKVSHYRVMQWSHWFAGLLDSRPEDRMYNCLPLYHSVGGIVACGATLVAGGAVVIRARFSASDFWRDVIAERCTLFQYIGELCRYLISVPPQAIETGHSLRLACGNGLRPEVWNTFKRRFRIPRILEYYASTEGNFSLYNCEEEPGAIGRIPSFLAQRLPVALLRFDVARAEPVRNAAGFCERCEIDEVGEAVGLIPRSDAVRGGRFEGYAEAEATARKVLRQVFEPEDAWYRTGDLMRRDARGFYYFVDRIGDTYRWKGENVSTTEVLSALSGAAGVLEGVVYGVGVPGTDGRAGMAALVVTADFDLAAFRSHVTASLPAYARPLFLRLSRALESTGTFKPRKLELMREGFDPARIGDALYVDDPRSAAYVPLDPALYMAIANRSIRF